MVDKKIIIVYALFVASLVIYTGNKVNKYLLLDYFQILGLLMLTAAFILLFNCKITCKIKPIYYLVFLPIWLIPAIRCRFQIPYIFCHLCPGRCAWGEFRKMFIPFYLLLNVENRFWCWNLCPLGQLQDAMPKSNIKPIPKILTYIRFIILALAVYLIFFDLSYTLQVHYTYSIFSIIIILILLLTIRYLPRVFCHILCPIGAFSDIVLKIRKITQL